MGKLIKTTEYGTQPNTYDLLKYIALAAMVIDHIGYYLLPEMLWLRVFGRVAFPLFLFLVGYSGNHRFDGWLLAGAALVWLNAGFTGGSLLPLNILFSILAWRFLLALGVVRPAIWKDLGMLWVALLVLYPFTDILLEYGTMGLMLVCTGYLVRVEGKESKRVRLFLLATVILMVSAQSRLFGFSFEQVMVYTILTVLMAIGMLHFKLAPLQRPAEGGFLVRLSPYWEWLIILCARNTLLLYVAHVILLQWVAYSQHPERFRHGFQALFGTHL